MKSRETNPYTVKKEGEVVQTLAHGLAQGGGWARRLPAMAVAVAVASLEVCACS